MRRAVPSEAYVHAIGRELEIRFETGSWPVDTLYFGGGTPSRLGGDGVARLLDVLRARLDLMPDAEVTLEANPEDITPDSIRAWAAAGINRLSIGAQSFDDRVLAWMHRSHDAAATVRAVEVARDNGIANLSLDLIFALPVEIERAWERDVERAIALGPDHLSLYGLTIEPHTPLGRWQARGDVVASPDERYESEFLYAHRVLTDCKFDHYEVSNFGRPGRRARHNSAYWTHAEYAGVGPSSHGFDGTRRRWNVSAYVEWTQRIATGADPLDADEELTAANRIAEQVYLGLRTTAGLALGAEEIARAQKWEAAGWGNLDARGHLTLTALGWLRLDALASDLTLVRSH